MKKRVLNEDERLERDLDFFMRIDPIGKIIYDWLDKL